jgi:uncharacterized protein
MKYLLVIAIVFLVLWLWRGSRREEEQERREANAARRPDPRLEQQEMIRCPVCSVHFPRSDALPGPDGQLYCCAEHRSRAEQRTHAKG